MEKWLIKQSNANSDTYLLRHGTLMIYSLTWFQKVKINKEGIRLYDRDILTVYYSIEILPKHIINKLEKLPKKEKQ